MTTKPRKKQAAVLACVPKDLAGFFTAAYIRFIVPSHFVLLLTIRFGAMLALLFLDQIKPIEQLVPVS
jgi:hypothetical protein